jgi:hypothetical protein
MVSARSAKRSREPGAEGQHRLIVRHMIAGGHVHAGTKAAGLSTPAFVCISPPTVVSSAGKMSGLWSGHPASLKLDGLDVLCACWSAGSTNC